MHFSTAFLISALTAMASAQNMFTMATIPTSIPVGSTFNITWEPSTQGTVSLLLVQASSPGSTLVHPVSTIAANISNSGAFAWIPSNLTPKGSGYAIEIIDDANPYITNYSGQFAVDSTTTASASTSGASVSGSSSTATAASTSSGSMSTGTASSSSSLSSGSMTSSMTTTGSVTTTTGSSTTLSTVTSSGTSSTAASSTSSATPTAKIGAASVETARSGFGLLAALGVAVLFL